MNAVLWLLLGVIVALTVTLINTYRRQTMLRRLLAVETWRADHDQLTRLANRYVLHRTLAGWLADRRPITLAMIDLDDLHEVNHHHGHAAGDVLLTVAADRLRRFADTTGGLAVRLGGDEFVVTWPDLNPTEVDTRSGELFHQLTADPVDIRHTSLPVGACIGVATSTRLDTTSPSTLLARADQARAHGKRSGKNSRILWHADLPTAGGGHVGRPPRRLRDHT